MNRSTRCAVASVNANDAGETGGKSAASVEINLEGPFAAVADNAVVTTVCKIGASATAVATFDGKGAECQ